MAAKLKPIYFDTEQRRVKLTLPSGPLCVFYRNRPERNPITDQRDVVFMLGRSEFFEVQEVGKGKDKRWVKRPPRGVRSRRAITSDALRQAAQTGPDATPGAPATKKDDGAPPPTPKKAAAKPKAPAKPKKATAAKKPGKKGAIPVKAAKKARAPKKK